MYQNNREVRSPFSFVILFICINQKRINVYIQFNIIQRIGLELLLQIQF